METEYPFTVKVYNILQYCNIILSLTIGAGFSLSLFIGLFHNRVQNGLNHYRNIILALSTTYFFSCLANMPLLPAVSLPTGKLVFLLGDYYPLWLSYVLITVADFMTRYANLLLAGSIIYKVISFVRPNWLSAIRIILPILIIPPPVLQYIFDTNSQRTLQFNLTCDLYCVDAMRTFPSAVHLVASLGDSSKITSSLDYSVFIFVAIITVPGVIILENWFRSGLFSPKTLKLQRDLSKAWIILMLLHGLVFLPEAALWLAKALPKIPGISLPLLFVTFTNDLIYWMTPIKTLVIFFTVRKMLHSPEWLKSCLHAPSNMKLVTPIV